MTEQFYIKKLTGLVVRNDHDELLFLLRRMKVKEVRGTMKTKYRCPRCGLGTPTSAHLRRCLSIRGELTEMSSVGWKVRGET